MTAHQAEYSPASRLPSLGDTEVRGQTEPLAALVAVGLVCATVSGYAAFATETVSEVGRDRALADVTADRLWDEISQNGIYPAGNNLTEQVSVETLPRGHHVYVAITYVGDDGRVVEQTGFNETGQPYELTARREDDSAERAIAVEHRRGDIRPGLLTVVVHNGTAGGEK